VAFGEEGDHLLDLDDLLGGAAEEAEEGFAEGLAQKTEAGKGRDALREMRIAAPGERIGQGGPVGVEGEVAADGGFGGRGEGAAPSEGGVKLAELNEIFGPEAGPDAG
jgi:hypothetical protein